MPPPLIGRALSDAFVRCLSVCHVHRAKVENREAYEDQNWHMIFLVTRDLHITFKVKRSKVKVTRPLYSARP